MATALIDERIINDPIFGRMDDKTFRRAMQLLVISNECGLLPSNEDIAWMLRCTEDEIKEAITGLTSIGIVKIHHSIMDEFIDSPSRKYDVTRNAYHNVTNNVMNNVTSQQDITLHNEEEKEIERKKKNAERAKRYRDKKKASRDVTPLEFAKANSELNNINNINNNNLINNNPSEFSLENSKVNPEEEILTLNPEEENDITQDNVTDSVTQSATRSFESFKWAKEEQNRAYWFYKKSGLYPLKYEYGRWIKELRQYTEAGIDCGLMIDAIYEMRRKNLRIKAPGSVFGIARDMMAKAEQQGFVEAPLSNEEIAKYLDDDEED